MNTGLLVGNVVATCAVAIFSASTAPPSATRVLEAVQRGEEVSLSGLFADEEAFYYVMERIAEGTSAWLDVAARLAPGADAHPGEELTNALSFALGNAPEAVLSRSFAPISLEFICGGPGLEEDRDKYRAALKRAVTAVSGVENPKLIEKRDACLELLKEAVARAATTETGR